RQRRRWRRSSTRRRAGSPTLCSGRWPPRVAMAEFVIRIPRNSGAVSEAELTELLVEHGQHVEEGSPLFTVATEKVEQEIEAGASGTGNWAGEIRDTDDIGAEIGVITS